MYQNTIYSGNNQIISSGLAIQFNNEPISIKIDLPGFLFELIFNFKDDKSNENYNIEPQVLSNNSAMITFTNFNDPLGIGSTSPMKIANYNDGAILLHYRIYSLIDSSDKTVHYSFYLSEGAE